jgi:hypothetical protein
MASGAKQKVAGRIMDCRINLGNFVMKVYIYVIILGSYDIVICMDWLESHDVILNYKTKLLSLTDDLGKSRVILGINQGVSLRLISSLQLHKIMCNGCKLSAILPINGKGEAGGLENLPLVQEFADMFPEELLHLVSKRELEFTTNLKPRTKPIVRIPYRMSTPKL